MAANADLQTHSDASVTSLVQGIVSDVQELIKQQMNMFKAEMSEDLQKTRNAILPLILGLFILLPGVLLLGMCLSQLLFEKIPGLPLWGAYGIVGAVVTGIALLLGYWGYKKFQSFNPLPDQSIEALKENLTWPTRK